MANVFVHSVYIFDTIFLKVEAWVTHGLNRGKQTGEGKKIRYEINFTSEMNSNCKATVETFQSFKGGQR